jgi:hypothetical protein
VYGSKLAKRGKSLGLFAVVTFVYFGDISSLDNSRTQLDMTFPQ